MIEKITICDLQNPEVFFPMDRDEFYKEQSEIFKKIGKPSKACQVVSILFFTKEKDIILQKRSSHKNHNANLLDKSVSGHVTFGDSIFYTVMVETIQELKIPSIILEINEDLNKTYELLKDYLDSTAIVKQIDNKILSSEKIKKGEKILIGNDLHLFFGIYSGSIKPVDKEASGVIYYNLDVLKAEMKINPGFFTNDLKFFLEHYKSEIDEFLASY